MRAAGILLPIFSLPNKYGIGCFSKEAKDFVDFLKESGQKYWQILPIGPVGYGASPYQSYSTFAINPLFIDLTQLIAEGVLTEAECKVLEGFSDTYVDYEKITDIKMELLHKAYERRTDHKALEEFARKEAYWLDAYAIFMGLHDRFKSLPFVEWEPEYSKPDWTVVDKYKEEYSDEVNFHRYVQFKAATGWESLKKYANENGIKIIGDLPIYVSPDGADVWIDRRLFEVGELGVPANIAGCPPDDFAPKGQLWGNPLYDWEYHKKTNYAWWVLRMKKAMEMFDVVRIDHFRGFDEYFSIPAKDTDATRGVWKKGPGMELFEVLKREVSPLNVIAEDLGFLTDSVRKLLSDSGFPGMKIIQFAYGAGPYNEYMPHYHKYNSVVYTGTHDNMTTLGWLEDSTTGKETIQHIIKYHGFSKDISMEELAQKLINVALSSPADTCIIPIQDYLGLGNEGRINTPSTIGKQNWKWRLKDIQLTKTLSATIKESTLSYGR